MDVGQGIIYVADRTGSIVKTLQLIYVHCTHSWPFGGRRQVIFPSVLFNDLLVTAVHGFGSFQPVLLPNHTVFLQAWNPQSVDDTYLINFYISACSNEVLRVSKPGLYK